MWCYACEKYGSRKGKKRPTGNEACKRFTCSHESSGQGRLLQTEGGWRLMAWRVHGSGELIWAVIGSSVDLCWTCGEALVLLLKKRIGHKRS